MDDFMEPQYVDDPFEDNGWKYPVNDVEKRMLLVTGRKRFPTESVSQNVHRITSLLVSGERKYPDDYIEQQIQWAKKMNFKGTVITLPKLISAIRNPDNLARYKASVEIENKSEDDELPDYSHLER